MRGSHRMYSAPVSSGISCHMVATLLRTASMAVAIVVAFTSACTKATTGGQPSITLTEVPQAGAGSSERLAPIAGWVSGARPGRRVVLFAKSGMWWVQPLVAKPFTDIAPDG